MTVPFGLSFRFAPSEATTRLGETCSGFWFGQLQHLAPPRLVLEYVHNFVGQFL